MEPITESYARLLVDQTLKHPIFGYLVQKPSDSMTLGLINRLKNTEAPSDEPNIGKFRRPLPKEKHALHPIERDCWNTLILREVISQDGFVNYTTKNHVPGIPQIGEIRERKGSAIYSSKDIVKAARSNDTIAKMIEHNRTELFLVCKYRVRWSVGEREYRADIPLLILPDITKESSLAIRAFELSQINCKVSHLGGALYTGTTAKEYFEKTGDYALIQAFARA